MAKVTTAEGYIEKNEHFKEALQQLRNLILSTELQETIKWSAPVYTLGGKNVLGLGAFKNHFGIWFFNGVFLKDRKGLLVNAQETTKALRQMRFESKNDINPEIVLEYVYEAIQNQRAGKEIKPKKTSKKVEIPEELREEFKLDSQFEDQFKQLTPGKQREYSDYITTAKRDATKQSRLQKIKPMIAKGVGLNDKYKNC